MFDLFNILKEEDEKEVDIKETSEEESEEKEDCDKEEKGCKKESYDELDSLLESTLDAMLEACKKEEDEDITDDEEESSEKDSEEDDEKEESLVIDKKNKEIKKRNLSGETEGEKNMNENSTLYNENGHFFLEDYQFDSLNDVLNEAIEKCLNENIELFNEAVISNTKSFIRTSENIMKQTKDLYNKYINKIKDGKNAKGVKKLYQLRRNVMTRLNNINNYMKKGQDASAVRYACYTGDVKMLGTMLEIPNLNHILQNLLVSAIGGVVGSGVISVANLITSRKVATSKEGRAQLNKYIAFLKSFSKQIESDIEKYGSEK